jgi:hypothetical protein
MGTEVKARGVRLRSENVFKLNTTGTAEFTNDVLVKCEEVWIELLVQI